jgi:uncharacterized protein (DUF433 family)
MLDTTPVTNTIAKLITAGVSEGELVARVVRQFPDLTTRELSEAIQVATTAAERQVARRH